ncbi:ABC transporter permease [Yoonia sp. SS1-5]|uniref:ABC transporter permease n=1 Tax=Yoonia rhodophyticola TaxID=3137370 RepID=A0AAN0M9X7_9RHOB
MQILANILKRVAYGITLVLLVVVMNFFLLQLAPGDPVDALSGVYGAITPEIREQITQRYGLDKPLLEQLAVYVGNLVRGDMGFSYHFNRDVSELILGRMPATLILLLTSLLFSITIGTILGVLASHNPKGPLSQFITAAAVLGYSTPIFWTGMLLVILFASVFPILPIGGMRSVGVPKTGLANVIDVAYHLILPALTLAFAQMAEFSRLTRAAMLDVLGSDYVRTARAKGLSERRVFFRHGLRNAILPLITMIGLQFGTLFAGAIVIETVFNWPGLGRLAFDSVLRRDHPTLLGILLFSAVLVVVVNQLTELVYRAADPRIKAA